MYFTRRKVKVRKTDKGLEFFAQNGILTVVFVHDLRWEQLLLLGGVLLAVGLWK